MVVEDVASVDVAAFGEVEGERRATAVDEVTGRPRSCLRRHGSTRQPHVMSL